MKRNQRRALGRVDVHAQNGKTCLNNLSRGATSSLRFLFRLLALRVLDRLLLLDFHNSAEIASLERLLPSMKSIYNTKQTAFESARLLINFPHQLRPASDGSATLVPQSLQVYPALSSKIANGLALWKGHDFSFRLSWFNFSCLFSLIGRFCE